MSYYPDRPQGEITNPANALSYVPASEDMPWEPDHAYLSTACFHRQHDYCKAETRPDGTEKIPASCKFCGAQCRCACHGATA